MKVRELEEQCDGHRKMRAAAAGQVAREEREVEACERLLGALKYYEEVFSVRVELLLDRGTIVCPAGKDKKELMK